MRKTPAEIKIAGMKFITMAGMCLGFACLAPAQIKGSLPLNARIYVDAPADFENDLLAAVADHHLPFTITARREDADYQLQAMTGANVIAPVDWAIRWLHGYGEGAIRVIDIRSGDTVFFAPLDRHALHDWGSAAKACAGRLRVAVSRSTGDRDAPHPILDF